MPPNSWERRSLGDLVTLRRGIDLPEAERRRGRVPIMGSFGVTGWHDVAACKGPGVTVGRSGASIGVASYIGDDYWPLNTCLYVTDFHGNNPRFAYYLLSTLDLARFNSGSAQPSLNRNFVHPIPVSYPGRAEQDSIAAILAALDDKIDLNSRMNETLEEMARAIFKDWFVDFGPTRAKMECLTPYLPSDIWSLFPDVLDDEAKPPGWRIGVLDDVLSEIEIGSRPRGGVSAYTSGIPSIGAESIAGLGIFDYSKTKFIPASFFEGMKKGHVRSRDVVLYKDGGRPGQFEPHVTLFGDGFPFKVCAINEHVYRLRAMPDFGQTLLYFWLSSDRLISEMRNKGTGVAVPGLNSTQVKTLTTLVPASEVVDSFDVLVDPLISRILANCTEAHTLGAMRDFLLPKLMSGEIRVRDAEKIAEAAQ